MKATDLKKALDIITRTQPDTEVAVAHESSRPRGVVGGSLGAVSPPLCTVAGCGATLPDPMVRAVVTCPGCGAKSEARTTAPESEIPPAYAEQASPMTTAVNAAREQERRRALRIIGEVRARWADEPSAATALAICDELAQEIEG